MNLRLLRQTLSARRSTLLIVVLSAVGWGALVPVFYTSFSELMADLIAAGMPPIIENLMNFGSGSFFTLPGALTIGLQHPMAIALIAVFATGAGATVIAGQRERGTLEVLLARPLSRHSLYLSMAGALLLATAAVLAALLVGQLIGSTLLDIVDEIDGALMPLVWLNGLLLWATFLSFALAMSVSFDRAGPAIGLSLAFLIVNYFLEILGSLWTDVEWTQEYSLFHHFQPSEILTGKADLTDLLILGVAALVPAVYAWIVFPRRDLAAPA
ncbi:MAG TPA: ABC transporter permease subunit [Candidatus Limnocylindria bacterium]|nr:ABC transporter permease subunit [Candidatus Limnocylindria bacterium]